MDGFEGPRIGSVPLFIGASKPKLFWGIDPRLFVPVGILVALAVFVFGSRPIGLIVCFALAALILMAGKVMGRWSPFFIDEMLRWLSWRSRTGSGRLAADATFSARDSSEASKWRLR